MRPQTTAMRLRRQLIHASRSRGEELYATLGQFIRERWLYRLAESPRRRDFVLKGAMCLPLWHPRGRGTDNLDVHDMRALDDAALMSAVAEVCTVPAEADGLVFLPDSMQLRERREPTGYRLKELWLTVNLGTVQTQLLMHVTSGETLTPPAEEVQLPGLLDLGPAKIKAVCKELFVAEKFHTQVASGTQNQRLFDLWDLFCIIDRQDVDGAKFTAATRNLFNRRVTTLPPTVPDCLSPVLASNMLQAAHWQALMRRMKVRKEDALFWGVLQTLYDFFGMPLEIMARNHGFIKTWSANSWQ